MNIEFIFKNNEFKNGHISCCFQIMGIKFDNKEKIN
ncbi:MAG: hypothetical protein CM1200mP30_04270 [Pseudomonadota bacterium]|nr:MAG: hypothetical protein CM1200mP30_04270 [Pseudomonadota bacterium]